LTSNPHSAEQLAKLVYKLLGGSSFGAFDTGFSIAWFIGSAAMGWLYDKSISLLVLFSILLQLAALAILFWAKPIFRQAIGVLAILRRRNI
jgi:hypothetical protein